MPWRVWGFLWKSAYRELGAVRRFRVMQSARRGYVDPDVQIVGYRNVTLGANSTLSEDTFLNVNSRAGITDRLVIGSNCHIGRRNYFSTGGLIELKDYVFTGLDCHFLGCGHNIDSPMHPYISTGLTEGAPIEIGVNCWLTTSVTILEGVTIGRGSVIGARSIVTQDIPAFSIGLGVPFKLIKRFDFKNNKWLSIRDWHDSLEEFMPAEAEYLAHLRSTFPHLDPSVHAASRRFGWTR